MKTQRKVILLTRHGETPKKGSRRGDALVPESVTRLYENTGGSIRPFVQGFNIQPKDSFLIHSDKVRTLYTGQAILAGAFGLTPVPQSQEDLAEIDFSGVDTREDPRLGYEGTKYNEEEMFRDMPAYFERWFADPTATTYDGVPITPFNEVIEKSRNCLVDALGNVIEGGKDLGVLSTHGSIVDAMAIAALNSARSTPITSFDELGGMFDREGFATLILDQLRSGSYQATLQRDGQNYDIDLGNLRN